MGIALCCVWAAYTNTELLKRAAATVMSPEAMAPPAAPPEVAAHAAEPSEAALLASAPCMVVASSNVLSACRVAVVETVTKLSLFSNETSNETISAICVCSVTPVIAKETINELSTYPVSIKKSNFEPYVCPVSTKEPDFELPFCPISVTEMSVGHVLVSNPVYKLSFCSASVSEPIDVLLFFVFPATVPETWPSVPPPVLPPLHRPPGLYWKAVPWGRGYVTNPVHALPFTHHQRSPAHHMNTHTHTHTHSWLHWLHSWFPSHASLNPWISSVRWPSIVSRYRYPS